MEEVMIVRSDNQDELEHHGILGMKWGVRRFQTKSGSLTNLGKKRYNSKDGTLNNRGKTKYDKETAKLKEERKALKNKARTQKKVDKLKDLNDEVDDLKKADAEAKSGESREEKRKRLLESTDAKEIYENRNLLTTAELNDRINRIDTEARLAGKIPEQKTGLDYVNEKMNRVSNTLNNATNMFQKVDNAYSTVSKSAIGKTIAKKLGIEPPRKAFDLDDFMKNISTKTDQEIQDKRNRVMNERILSQEQERRKKASGDGGSTNNSNSSNSSGSEKTNSESRNAGTTNNYSYNEKSSGTKSESSKVFTGTVEGEGRSQFTGFGKDLYDDNPIWRDVSTSSSNYTNSARIGQNYVAGYLSYNDKKK